MGYKIHNLQREYKTPEMALIWS